MSSSALRMLLLLLALLVFPACGHRLDLLKELGDNVPAMELVSVSPFSSEAAKSRVLCWLNTYHANHDKRLHAIKRTGGASAISCCS
ncbi:hypothetical protein GN244_ATG12404 [Phytophthora infestans]|uniref:Secreted RxLR effector peptide protein n=1 Tax=Phytophthora infestans TaxID=4787 RepID=A0A833SLJ3_PHYIN|nr:hypothetical protein GN244_ATG12404 [Phytophthora infestans]KAF4138571.1 hypothetical protein GN958_ATG12219 [Phytophthora infestans]